MPTPSATTPTSQSRRGWPLRFVSVWLLLSAVAGCRSTPDRNPTPTDLVHKVCIPGIPMARSWGDSPAPETEAWMEQSEQELEAGWGGIMNTHHNYLALSGGGANGAFGAGLLCGWSANGDRPLFTVVTGISSGALIAPFAFLGSEYDDRLKQLLTTHSTDDMVQERSAIGALTGDSLLETDGMERIIKSYFDQELLDAIALASATGRRLLVATTNLDAGRPVIWNLSVIAMSGHPRSLDLFHEVLLASAAIPIAFPPVLIDVAVEGETFDEMHVDGGVTAQVFWFPVELHWGRVTQRLKVRGTPNIYVIRNGFVTPRGSPIAQKLIPIAMRSVAALIRTQGVGDLYAIYVSAQRDGLNFRLAAVPESFSHEAEEVFDKEYMQALFRVAFDMAVTGYPWAHAPDGVEN